MRLVAAHPMDLDIKGVRSRHQGFRERERLEHQGLFVPPRSTLTRLYVQTPHIGEPYDAFRRNVRCLPRKCIRCNGAGCPVPPHLDPAYHHQKQRETKRSNARMAICDLLVMREAGRERPKQFAPGSLVGSVCRVRCSVRWSTSSADNNKHPPETRRQEEHGRGTCKRRSNLKNPST